MLNCPVCGSEIETMPYFDVRQPENKKQIFLHKYRNGCPASNITPPVKYQTFNGDCLTGMRLLPDKSVDLILCDLPYGVLNSKNPNAKWDSVIPFPELWEQYDRIIKDNGAIVLFASGMFTSDLMQSNRRLWKYNLIWKKGNRPTGFLNAKKQPLRIHEDICVFYKKQPTYNPQFTVGEKCHSRGGAGSSKQKQARNGCYGEFQSTPVTMTNEKYPLSIVNISKEHPQSYHPTQKPVALLEYLIKTYTNEGEIVLDNCFGSGSTLVAALNCNRVCVGFEKEAKYFDIASERLKGG